MEAYLEVGAAQSADLDDDGRVTNESTAEFLQRFLTELDAFIARVYLVLPGNV